MEKSEGPRVSPAQTAPTLSSISSSSSPLCLATTGANRPDARVDHGDGDGGAIWLASVLPSLHPHQRGNGGTRALAWLARSMPTARRQG